MSFGVLSGLVLGLLLAASCGAPQIPPGPAPEYERPQVEPWDAGPVEDPLAAIEAGGEWVDEPGSAGGASPLPAGPPSGPRPASSSSAAPSAASAPAVAPAKPAPEPPAHR